MDVHALERYTILSPALFRTGKGLSSAVRASSVLDVSHSLKKETTNPGLLTNYPRR